MNKKFYGFVGLLSFSTALILNSAQAQLIGSEVGATYFVDGDNWGGGAANSAADDDFDIGLKNQLPLPAKYPIEAKLTGLSTLPTQSAHLLVRAYDVDDYKPEISASGEWNRVYGSANPADIQLGASVTQWPTASAWNNKLGDFREQYTREMPPSAYIGTLIGQNEEWSVSVLPFSTTMRSQLAAGEFYLGTTLHHYVDDTRTSGYTPNTNWQVTIDWMQLVIDGGAREAAEWLEPAVTVETGKVTVEAGVFAKAAGNYAVEMSVFEKLGNGNNRQDRSAGFSKHLLAHATASSTHQLSLIASDASISTQKEYFINLSLFSDRGYGSIAESHTNPGAAQHVLQFSTRDFTISDIQVDQAQLAVNGLSDANPFGAMRPVVSGVTLNNPQSLLLTELPNSSQGRWLLRSQPVAAMQPIGAADIEFLRFERNDNGDDEIVSKWTLSNGERSAFAPRSLVLTHVDSDGDGVAKNVDNCLDVANPDQLDTDNDGQGDACDDDIDGDGVQNTGDICPQDASNNCLENPAGDFDGDGVSNDRDEMPEDSRRWFTGGQQLPKLGDAAKQRYGQVLVNLGDVDGDFIDDYAIGTPQYRATHIVNEKAKRFVKAGRLEIFSGKTGVRLFDEQGAAAKQLFGSAIVSGDFNDDDIVDIAIGSPGANKNTGAVSIYWGSGSGSFGFAETLIVEQQPKALFGASLAVAELDGKQQLFVGMPKAKNSDTKKITGAVARYQQGLFDKPALRFGELVKSEYGAALLWLPKAQTLAIGAPEAYKTGVVDIWNVAQNTSTQLQGGYVGERYGSVMAVGSLLAGAEHLAVAGPLASTYGFKKNGRIELFNLATQEWPINTIDGLTSAERLGSSLAFAVPSPIAGGLSVDMLYAGSPNYSVPKVKKLKQVGKVSELSFGGVRNEKIGTQAKQQFGAALAEIELNGDFSTELLIHSPGANDPNNKKSKASGRVDAYSVNGLYPMQTLE